MTSPSTDAIRRLNDAFRTTLSGGNIFMTPGVAALPAADSAAVLARVVAFADFTPANDPHGEHDFGAFDHAGTKYFWKIDCYAPDMMHGSDNPADPARTRRVLTIMRADEY